MYDINYRSQIAGILAVTGWSQKKLAGKLGINPVTISGWYASKSKPRAKTLEKLQSLFTQTVATAFLTEDERFDLMHQTFTAGDILGDQRIFDDFVTLFTYHSLLLEGQPFTLGQVNSILQTDVPLRQFSLSDQLLVKNHATTLVYLLNELRAQGRGFRLSREMLREIHLRLFCGLTASAGSWRVRTGKWVDWHLLPGQLERLVAQLNNNRSDPLEAMVIGHTRLLELRPFELGTGLVARLVLMIQALQRELYPPLIIDAHAHAYQQAVASASSEESLPALADIVVGGMSFTAKIVE